MFVRIAVLVLCFLSAPAHAEWHEASSENFLVIADQNEKDVRQFTERLERYHSALTYILNREPKAPSPSNRVTIYVVKSADQVRKLAGDKTGYLQGFYQPRAGGSVAFVSRIDGGGKELDDSERVLFHEYAHHVMQGTTEWAWPRWVSEGFAEFYSTARFERDGGVSVGLPASHRAAELALARNVPIEALLDRETYLKSKSKAYDEFYGRSWALYHYLLVSNKRPGQLVDYLVALANGKSELEAAREAFGDLALLEKDLNAYLRQSRLLYLPITGDKISIGAITTRKMRAAEAAMMPIVLESKRGVNRETATPLLVRAQAIAAQYPADSAVLAALAEAEHDAGNFDSAVKASDKALAADPKLVNAHVQKIYALTRLAEDAQNGDTAWKLVRRAVTALNKVETDHPIPLIYYFRSLQGSGQEISELAAHGLERALQLAPYDKGVRWQVVQQLIAEEDFATAYRMVMPLANDPHNNSENNPAKALLATIKQQMDAKAPTNSKAGGPAPVTVKPATS